MSSLSLNASDNSGALLALRWSYSAGSTASVKMPCSRSTALASTRSSKTASTLVPGSNKPAAPRMLRFTSSDLLATCAGRSSTAAADTITEQTIHSSKVTMIVFLKESLLDTCQSPLNVRLYYKMVNQRGKQVCKQNRQHHAFRKGRIRHTNNDHHQTDKRTKPKLTRVSHRGRHR